jgi:hypothetical protein
MWFELTMDHVSIGMSFRQAVVAIQHARDHTKTATLSGMNDLIVGQYVRVLVSGNLQDSLDLMGDLSVWATCLSGPSRLHSTRAPISSSHSLIYASRSPSRVGSVTFT